MGTGSGDGGETRKGSTLLGLQVLLDAVLVPVAAVPKDQQFESLKTTDFGSPGCCVPMCLLYILASVSILLTGMVTHNHLLTCMLNCTQPVVVAQAS